VNPATSGPASLPGRRQTIASALDRPPWFDGPQDPAPHVRWPGANTGCPRPRGLPCPVPVC